MTREPDVWIIVLNWNGKAVTLECLDSLTRITYAGARILLVDNGSTDDSVAAVRAAHPEVAILETASNLGFAAGMNAGMRHALDHGAGLLLLLNNDTVVDREFLGFMVTTLLSDESIGMVAPKIYYAEEPTRLWFAGGAVSLWLGATWHVGIREFDRGQYDGTREIPHATGCCLLVRKRLIDSVGLLDESFRLYAEDADWVMRARRRGFTVCLDPRAKIWHKVSVSSGGHLSWQKNWNKFLGNFRFFARYASWYHWVVFPWASILVNAGFAVRYALRRR